jgi:ATP-binding cassette, subfamily G (WHITE), member 2, SNQ2
VTLFKQGSRAAIVQDAQASASDEEKAQTTPGRGESTTEKETVQAPAMTDVFSWQHLNYYVPVSGGERQLLNDVSGYVAPGKLTALMGESGAGKTTLLNVLAERVGSGVVRGDRFVNGQALPPDFQAQTGYVQQMDTHVANMTVREALRFSADMRQPQSVPAAEKAEYVEKCLKMCGLEAWADAIVGSLGVEHRKRTTIGVELAAKPRLLLFLDEPTSGAWLVDYFRRGD